MEVPVPYSQIENAYAVNRWDTNQKFYIRIVVSDGSVLLQVKIFFHSLFWILPIFFFKNITTATKQMGT